MVRKSTVIGIAGAITASVNAVPVETQPSTWKDSPEPTWTTLDYRLPYPYGSGASMYLTSNGLDSKPTAIVGLFRTNPCGGGTAFASTTVINYPVDCRGGSALTVSVHANACPMGMQLPPPVVDTYTATPSTKIGFTCASTTPFTLPSVAQLTPVTHTLPVPTLRPDQHPPEKPDSLKVVHYPDGTCRVMLGLEQVDPQFESRKARVNHECLEQKLHPSVYTKTVTMEGAKETVTVEGTKTRWVYDCEPRTGDAV